MIDRLSALLRLVCLVLAPMSALFLGPAVHGQGTMGQLPDPMSSEELQTHLGRYLDFDVDQALRIGPMHEEYLIEFKALRDGRITAWLEDARELQGTSQIPDVRALRRFVGEQESILASIRKIDDRLFNRISELFDEDDLQQINRARMSRVRTRARTGMSGQMGMTTSQDLWDVVDTLNLTTSQRKILSQALIPWEERSTVLSLQASKSASSMMIKMVEKLDEIGFDGEEFGDLDYSDPESMRRLQELMLVIQQVYLEAREESGAAAEELRRFNSRTVRGLENTLDPWIVRSFKSAFLENAGGGLSTFLFAGEAMSDSASEMDVNAPGGLFVYHAGQAFERDPLSFIQKLRSYGSANAIDLDSLETMLQAYVVNDLKDLNRVVKIQEDIDPTVMGFEAMAALSESPDPTDPDSVMESVETPMMTLIRESREVQLLRDKRKSEFIMNLAMLLDVRSDPELERQVVKNLRLQDSDTRDSLAFTMNGGFTSGVMSTFMAEQSRPWILDPIDDEVVSFLAESVGEEEWLVPVFRTMHDDYQASWVATVQPLVRQYSQADQDWDMGRNSVVRPDGQISPETLDSHRRAAMESIQAADTTFFDTLLITAPPAAVPSVELARNARMLELALAGSGQAEMLFVTPSASGNANVIQVLIDSEIDRDVQDQIARSLASEFEMIIAERRALQQILLDQQLKRQTEWVDLRAGENSAVAFSLGANDELEAQREKVATKEQAYRDRVLEFLPVDSHQEFIRALRVAAHPVIYTFDDNVQSAFELTGRMTNLRDDQVDSLNKIKAEFTEKWHESGGRSVEAQAMMTAPQDMGNSEEWNSYLSMQMRFEEITFERQELAMQTLRHIAGVLDADQRASIPALQKLATSSNAVQTEQQVSVPIEE